MQQYARQGEISPYISIHRYIHLLLLHSSLRRLKHLKGCPPQFFIVLQWFRVDMHLDPEQEQLGTRGKATGAQLPRHNLTSKRHSCKSVGSPTTVSCQASTCEPQHECRKRTHAHMGARTQNTRKHTFGIHAEHHMGSPGTECSCAIPLVFGGRTTGSETCEAGANGVSSRGQ